MVRIPNMVGTWGYNPRKAAHAAAYFAIQSGGQIKVLKLVKLLYLAEREYMDRFDDPMFYDKFVSMDHGPVPSITLNLINGLINSDEWSEFIANRGSNYDIGLSSDEIHLESLDELSEADEAILGDLWKQFGHMDRFELVDHMHKNCPEWEDPDGSSTPISHELVYKFLKKENAHELSNDVATHRALASAIAKA
ncbi:Panacea domain-containing protein [Sneathiella sp.]|uniref:Panacea domain-containing protein n=1 Tax=Sneathiella sp. TaxID=1964365 RepID=UPI00356A2061